MLGIELKKCMLLFALYFLFVLFLAYKLLSAQNYIFSAKIAVDSPVDCSALQDVEVILVLGGGVPLSKDLPPPWVQTRCLKASEIYSSILTKCHRQPPKILTLSGGSANLPILIDEDGFPIFESTAAARYLISTLQIPSKDILFEVSSYDTIGNAFFARASFVDIQNWSNLLVITSASHMNRTIAIFDWVFALAPRKKYSLMYVETKDVGLDSVSLSSRLEREHISLTNLYKLIARSMEENWSLKNLLTWMVTEHRVYSSGFLNQMPEQLPMNVLKSYGGKF